MGQKLRENFLIGFSKCSACKVLQQSSTTLEPLGCMHTTSCTRLKQEKILHCKHVADDDKLTQSARVRKQARESGQASWPATNARVSRQQTRESAGNKRASQAKKKTIRESPARKRPKEAESPARKRPKEAEHPTDTASFGPLARWPVALLAGFCIP